MCRVPLPYDLSDGLGLQLKGGGGELVTYVNLNIFL